MHRYFTIVPHKTLPEQTLEKCYKKTEAYLVITKTELHSSDHVLRYLTI